MIAPNVHISPTCQDIRIFRATVGALENSYPVKTRDMRLGQENCAAGRTKFCISPFEIQNDYERGRQIVGHGLCASYIRSAH